MEFDAPEGYTEWISGMDPNVKACLDHHAHLLAQGAKRRKKINEDQPPQLTEEGAKELCGAFSALGSALAESAKEAAQRPPQSS